MGETRVDLLHLLEDLRDAYPGASEETILTEIVANAIDSDATTLTFTADTGEQTLTIVDDGGGMRRRDLARYHDLAATTKVRRDRVRRSGDQDRAARLRRGADGDAPRPAPLGHDLASVLAPPRSVEVATAARFRRWARHGRAPEGQESALAAPRPWLHRGGAPTALPASPRSGHGGEPRGALPTGHSVHHQRPARRARNVVRARAGARRGAPGAQAAPGCVGLLSTRPGAPAGGKPWAGDQHLRQGDQARLGMARAYPIVDRPHRRAHRSAGPRRGAHAQQGGLRSDRAARRHLPRVPKG